jgi:nitroimidazol reductase NimA-like FMN-containing flavoprotein (pyridoxamine 5'-phosphate oxidase superfamily)
MGYRSVVGYGYISIVNDEEERVRALDHIMSHYSGNKKFTYKPETLERTMVLRLDISEISGKQCK